MFRPHNLLILGLFGASLTQFGWANWEIARVRVDVTDLIVLGMIAALALGRDRPSLARLRAIPLLHLWVAYGLLRSIAYLAAPISSANIDGLIGGAYQLYRYCWKPLLYYPLAVLLLTSSRRRDLAIFAIVLGADIAALEGIRQGYSGIDASSFFSTKNQFGGFMVVPTLMCIFRVVLPGAAGRIFYFVSLPLLVRSLVFTSSRGAFVAVAFGVACLFAGLYFDRTARRRVTRFAAAALLGAALVVASRPNLFERPNIQILLTATRPTEVDNFRWREERWAHFWTLVLANPLLGVWSDNDFALGERTNTPHNGYLSIAIISGLPSLVVFALLLVALCHRGMRIWRRGGRAEDRTLSLACVCGVLAVSLHNVSESTFTMPAVGNLTWVLCAWIAMSPQSATHPVVRRRSRPSTAHDAGLFGRQLPAGGFSR
jgi:O-antigen ligase